MGPLHGIVAGPARRAPGRHRARRSARVGCRPFQPGHRRGVPLLASVLAGWLWQAYRPTATFAAGALFSGVTTLLLATSFGEPRRVLPQPPKPH